MTADALAMLNRLALPFDLQEWSEERELDLLDRAYACFLPVNAQRFSMVKSLNRAVSALSSGTQVLSAGYPLYQPLSDFVYRSGEQMVADLVSEKPALAPDTVDAFMETMYTLGAPRREAERLIRFFENLNGFDSRIEAGTHNRPICVIHGRDSPVFMHDFARAMGAISVSSPLHELRSNHDVRIAHDSALGGMAVYVSSARMRGVERKLARSMTSHGSIPGGSYKKILLERLVPDRSVNEAISAASTSPINLMAEYGRILADVKAALQALFPSALFLVSEHIRLPLQFESAAGDAAREVA